VALPYHPNILGLGASRYPQIVYLTLSPHFPAINLSLNTAMYLQSLELVGFKSFAHKTVLDFHPGITSIVGPNGCGKSNVLDAIRWVLGEQSAKALRGGEMADVIFSGTDSKQGVGMAEVSLTFADCEKELGTEYNEVRITRRVFRDGRSEYLLNKTVCRLKDIQMLFMDTGIGRSAYSIMEQGKIDLVLSSRPEDRRAIFEEAAGITKYKAQKKEALRKLEYTDANLVRLADIMKEVKRQIGSLQRQAGKARRYKSLFDHLKTLDTHACRRSHDETQQEIIALEKEIQRLRELQRSLAEQVESQEFGLMEQRRELDALEEQSILARQQVQDLRNQVESASNRIAFNEERIDEAHALSQRHQSDISAAEEKSSVQQTQLEETDHQLQEIFQTLRAEEQHLQERQNQTSQLRSERQQIEQSAQELQRQIQRAENKIATLRGELSSTLNQRETCETRLGLLQKELTQTGGTTEQLTSQVSTIRTQLEQAEAALQQCRETLLDNEHAQTTLQKELGKVGQEIVENERALGERESRLDVLKQLNEEGAGLGVGSEAVLKGLSKPELYRAAILGALANLIEVESEFVPAIEAALGQHLRTIFIRDPAVAEAIAAELKQTKVGRAAIMPTSFLPKHSAVQLQTLPDRGLAWALDRIKSQAAAIPLVNRLLENVVLARDLETAFELKRTAPDLAVATLAGEYISREGVVTAGANAHSGNSILQRKIQIRQLQREAASIRDILGEQKNRKEAFLLEAESLQGKILENREGVQHAQIHASTLQGQLSLLDRELREAEAKAKSLAWERDSVQQRFDAARDKVQALESEVASNTVQHSQLQEKLASALAEVDSLRKNEDSLVDILNELKIRVATEKQREENLQRQRQPIAGRLTELSDLISSRRKDIEHYASRVEQLTTENESLRSKISTLQIDRATAESQVAELQRERSSRVQSLEAVELNLRQLRKQLTDCQESRGQQEVKATQLNLKLEHLKEHAAHRYQIDLTTFEPDWYAFQVAIREQRKRLDQNETDVSVSSSDSHSQLRSDADWDFVKTAIAEITERLDAMGPVNMEAIQEYDELEERQRFLDEQHNDLVRSKNELLEVINKINATTKELFAETFEQIRVNFQEMFGELFGGGKANLLLVDDSDPLESGIEIIAKPPGKQLQSISLLSGGEKTMTAVSLLFAIYMVKPSPFCVLDEMDAPLDESNINRFIKILDRFVGQSQFVVITHNKRTIAKSDLLYGITMEEHGISKLIGVKLTTRAAAHQQTDFIGTEQLPPSIAESFGKHGDLHSERK
jgi:chromosome segregation protein